MRLILEKYFVSTIGLFLVALGIALSIISNLGTSPLSCPAYILSLKFTPTVGEFTIIINMLLILIQLAVLRRSFKLKYLMQIPATLIFGYMIDFWVWVLGTVIPGTLVSRWLLVIAGSLISAVGVSLEVAAQAWMLSAEMTVYAFTKVCDKPFSTLKIIMDCLYVVIAGCLSYLLFGNVFGAGHVASLQDIVTAEAEGIVIGIGTVALAVLPGLCMKLTDPLVDTLMAGIRLNAEDNKWESTRQR